MARLKGAKRQKNQLELSPEGTEAPMAKRIAESLAPEGQWMEKVCQRENRWQAFKRVKGNGGSPGIDGMTVDDFADYLKQHWITLREQLLSGTYQPQPVRRVEIPKPDGGVRKLGIPTVLDRLIQQAVMEVLQRSWDHTLSESSYGFRPGRSAHQAVARAQQHIAAAHRWVVDLDLENFYPLGNLTHQFVVVDSIEELVRRKVDLFPRCCRISFLTNLTGSWSDEGIVLYDMRTTATSTSVVNELAIA